MLNPSTTSRLQWNSNLECGTHVEVVRKSSIICTLGPVTQSVEMITKLRDSGMNIARLNFSHGSHEYHQVTINNIREAEYKDGKVIAIALDTKGPEIRTGDFIEGKISFNEGHEIELTTDESFYGQGTVSKFYVDYPKLPQVVVPGNKIFIDDGVVELEVVSTSGTSVFTRARNSGTLSNKKGVNLPDSDIDLPALSVKDKSDLDFGVKNRVDIIFASFIRTADDVQQIRNHLGEKGKYIKIICKIESRQGVKNIDEIIEATDGIMIARGDLGIEIPAEQVFLVQKKIISKYNILGKPVICATQMLESMTEKPRPTRAEVSDVANAILDGADCVMLSGETAKGAYPIEAVQMMDHIVRLAESTICYPALFNDIRSCHTQAVGTTEATSAAAVNAASAQEATAIVALSTSGNACRLLSKYRPQVPVFMVTRDAHVARQGHLHRGVYPLYYKNPAPPHIDGQPTGQEWQADVDMRVKFAIDFGRRTDILHDNDRIVTVQGFSGGIGKTNTMRILRI